MTLASLLLLVLSAPPAAATVKAKAPVVAKQRKLQRRDIPILDSTRQIEVHVAAGFPTTLTFVSDDPRHPETAKLGKHALADQKYFSEEKVMKAENLLVLMPEKDIAPGEAVELRLSLADGTMLPPIFFSSSPDEYDQSVTLPVQLHARASADSASSLKAQVVDLQGRLDECNQAAGDVGAAKVAEFVLRQDLRKPVTFVVEHHPLSKRDKQSALRVEVHDVYRLFDVSYLVLSVQNRDPDKVWVLDRAEVSITGGGASVDAHVLSIAREAAGERLKPDEEAKFVIAFATPTQEVDQRCNVKLLEREGNRHVELSDLKL
jgi:hypothetical protein